MSETNNKEQAEYQVSPPNPGLRQLDKLTGTWKVNGREFGTGGEITGQIRFEWMEGGYFLVQHIDILHSGQPVKGMEIIGYQRGWDGVASQDCISHFYSNTGDTFTYIYDVTDDKLTIWGGERGAPAGFKGAFSPDLKTITGAWEWPGGGYSATMTRVKG